MAPRKAKHVKNSAEINSTSQAPPTRKSIRVPRRQMNRNVSTEKSLEKPMESVMVERFAEENGPNFILRETLEDELQVEPTAEVNLSPVRQFPPGKLNRSIAERHKPDPTPREPHCQMDVPDDADLFPEASFRSRVIQLKRDAQREISAAEQGQCSSSSSIATGAHAIQRDFSVPHSPALLRLQQKNKPKKSDNCDSDYWRIAEHASEFDLSLEKMSTMRPVMSDEWNFEDRVDVRRNDTETGLAPKATSQGKLDLFGFASKHFYDVEKGVPKSLNSCEAGINAFQKHPCQIDISKCLQLAHAHHGENVEMEQVYLGLASLSMTFNYLLRRDCKKTPSEDECSIVDRIGFSIDRAERFANRLELPSGHHVLISKLFKDSEESEWCSTYFDAHTRQIVNRILQKLSFICFPKKSFPFLQVSELDPWFPAFSSSKGGKTYVSCSDAFFECITGFIITGFKQENTRNLRCRVTRRTRELLHHTLDRARKMYNERNGREHSIILAERLRNRLAAGTYSRRDLTGNSYD